MKTSETIKISVCENCHNRDLDKRVLVPANNPSNKPMLVSEPSPDDEGSQWCYRCDQWVKCYYTDSPKIIEPVPVYQSAGTAVQFDGSWASVEAIRVLLSASAPTESLTIRIDDGSLSFSSDTRIDKGNWVIVFNSGHFAMLSDDEFSQEYVTQAHFANSVVTTQGE